MISKGWVIKISPVIFLALFFILGIAFAETAEEAFDKGVDYAYSGGYSDEAIAEFNRAISINPNYTEAYNRRGWAYGYRKGNYDQAISDCNKAIEIDPKLNQAYSNRGFMYYKKGNYDQAWEDVHKAESLGYDVGRIDSSFLNDLKKASGREN